MLDRQESLFVTESEPVTEDATYLLTHLEVFNWGPFGGLHRADFDPNGTAIIGPTGSGKTTLIDALMTLLVSQPRYNLASTGGHESDRTLISYIRGVLGGDGSDGRDEVARPGKTITGICATYQAGDQTLRLGGLLWTDGPSKSMADLKRRWFFSMAEDQTLEGWLRLLHEDGPRALKRISRETSQLRVFESKKAYLAHTRKFFDVSENAFTLLNRAAGLKQLNSIDEIFRDLVLDDRTAFDRAIEVAGEFDNLAGIHAELETAKRQHESLLPIAQEHGRLLKSKQKTDRLRTLKQILPIWFAVAAESAWAKELARIATERDDAQSKLGTGRQAEVSQTETVETLRERYLELGGNVIGELEKTIELQSKYVSLCGKHAADYRRLVRRLELDEALTEMALIQNQATLQQTRGEVQTQRDAQERETLSILAAAQQDKQEATNLAESLRKVQERPGSNIPPRFQDFRSDLASQLALTDGDLPFVAELMEVQPDESAWRGAIERAVGSERLRILVPDDSLDAALGWVNSRDN